MTVSGRLRILIAVHGYPPGQTGGAERRAQRTAVTLASRGHEVHVLAADPTVEDREPTRSHVCEGGVQVHRLAGLDRVEDTLAARDDNPRVAAAVGALLARSPFDLVHQFSGYLTSAAVIRVARAHRVPVVVSLTDYWWLCHRVTMVTTQGVRCEAPSAAGCMQCEAEMKRRWRYPGQLAPGAARMFWAGVARRSRSGRSGRAYHRTRVERLVSALNSAAMLISPSTFVAEAYARHGVSRGRLRVSRQGVDLASCPLRPAPDAFRAGYIGQVKAHKGVDLILEAWDRLPDTGPRRLTIYGSDTGEEGFGRSLRNRLEGTPGAEWAGTVPPAGLWEALARLDVVVVPSRWAENSPNVILEAQAMGVPVVATRLGGIPELVVDGQNGLLVEPDSPDALARALQRLMDDGSLRRRLARGALPFRTIDDEITDVLAAYESVLMARRLGRVS